MPSPLRHLRPRLTSVVTGCLLSAVVAIVAWPAGAVLAAEPPGAPPLLVRITWGGGRARPWAGSIQVRSADGAIRPLPAWRPLATDGEAVARLQPGADALGVVAGGEPVVLDGIELAVPDWSTDRIEATLAADGATAAVTASVAVADLLTTPTIEPLDTEANRLSFERAPGDDLRVVFDDGAADGAGQEATCPTLRRPGESLRLWVHALLAGHQGGGTSVELRARIVGPADGTTHGSTAVLLHEVAAGEEAAPARCFDPVPVDLVVPPREAAYDIVLEVVERSGLRWSRPIASRTIQCVAVSAVAPAAPTVEWKTVCEVDPASPRLLERLRRLPGVGLPGVTPPGFPLAAGTLGTMPSMPKVPLPSLPLPSLPRLPPVGDMVPRFTGLLAVGHSTLVPHPAGAVLRLPPAPGPDEPSWEGIAVAGLEPGHPHLVEIEYPLAQDALVGLTVLEQVGGQVQATAVGGIAIERGTLALSLDTAADGMGRHRFVFWPHTRAGVVVVSNAAVRTPLHIGRIRLLAGPERLPPTPAVAPRAARRLMGLVPEPDVSRFGGSLRVDPATGRGVTDWQGLLTGYRAIGQWIAAQGGDGAVVTMAADGGAAWPSASLHSSPRWDSGGSFAGRLDPAPKDALALACRLFARENLALVPAVAGTGPLPVIDALLADARVDRTGLLCIGADGRPRRGKGVAGRYNILDPRVQDACAAVLAELAARVRDEPTVSGLALVIPHDGWLHCPGVASGLDDATFARFLAAVGPVAAGVEPAGQPAGQERFATRAALVEGPLREPWLEWRAAEIARFHHRLADAVRAVNPDWTLAILPTTLFTSGEQAARFRPLVPSAAGDADARREVGFDPARITAHGGIIFGTAHATAATADIVESGVVHRANRAVAGQPAASRRAAVLVSQSRRIDLAAALPHMPLKGDGDAVIVDSRAVLAGPQGHRPLSAVLAGGDVEMVIDETLTAVGADDNLLRDRRRLAVLPSIPLAAVPRTSAPLVARIGEDATGTWVSLVNLAGEPCRALLTGGAALPAADDPASAEAFGTGGDTLTVPLGPWQVRTVRLAGAARIERVQPAYDPAIGPLVDRAVGGLRRRRAALETPLPLAVLDNPSFEHPELGDRVAGWELLEPHRGTLRATAGGASAGGRGLEFATVNGLATLRSNPFPAPATGRISVAVWLRLPPDSGQPPLRIALEGLDGGREYYRFAPVGMAPGAMPLARTWSQFVLQVDDLPTEGIESLRVRLDLLGPGGVEIDDVRVFDLAFDESQRVQLTKLLALLDHHLADADVGGCLAEIDDPWARFLLAFVPAPAVPVVDGPPPADTRRPPARSARQTPASGGMIDRFRQWWK